MKFISFTIKKV